LCQYGGGPDLRVTGYPHDQTEHLPLIARQDWPNCLERVGEEDNEGHAMVVSSAGTFV
jgi:hypothetical protein